MIRSPAASTSTAEIAEGTPGTGRTSAQSTPSFCISASSRKPTGSSPTAVSSATLPPSRAMLVAALAAMPSAISKASSGRNLPGPVGRLWSR